MIGPVYVAASSAELERASAAMAHLRAIGIEVVSMWIKSVVDVGSANPINVGTAERARWSRTCLEQIRDAAIVYLLAPPRGAPSCGAWLEFGYAQALGKQLVSSGDTKQSIFCALGDEFATDADALAWFARGCVAEGEMTAFRASLRRLSAATNERDTALAQVAALTTQIEIATVRTSGAHDQMIVNNEQLRAERDACRAMVCDLLASASPHPTEHPTMARQWERARALLKDGPLADAVEVAEQKRRAAADADSERGSPDASALIDASQRQTGGAS